MDTPASTLAQEYVESGQQHLKAARFLIALSCFEQAIIIKPELAEAWEGKAATLRKLGRHKEAISFSDEAINLRMNVVENNVGNRKRAITYYDESLELNSDYIDALVSKAVKLNNLGRYTEALNLSDQAIAIDSEDAHAWYVKGFAQEHLGFKDDAIFSYESAVRLNPEHISAFNDCVGILVNSGCNEEAIFKIEQAVQFDPNDVKFWQGRDNELRFFLACYFDALVGQGVALNNLGRYTEALNLSDQAIAIHSEDAHAWYVRGYAQEHLNLFEDACTSYQSAIKFNAEHVPACVRCGALFIKIGQYNDALIKFEQATEFDPIDVDAWCGHGNALDLLGFHEEAIISYDQAIKIKPEFTSWRHRGVALDNLGRYEEAITNFDLAIKFDQDLCEAWANRGNTLNNLGRYNEAINNFDYALCIKPDCAMSLNNRGLALMNSVQYKEALNNFNKAIELNSDESLFWHNRGVLYERLQHYHSSFANLEQAIKLNPGFYSSWDARGIALFSLGRIDDAITNYDQGLVHILKETQPEGWGELYRGKGDIYHYQARRTLNLTDRLQYYSQALKYYNLALETLRDFPKFYLVLIQRFIKTYLNLDNYDAANHWRIEGLEIFRQLLNAQPTPQQKCRIETQFSGFSQVAVDALISTGDFAVALETAERHKNRCLTWILDEWQEQVTSPSYTEIRELLSKNHEIIYWHLSEEILTTFILTSQQEAPIVLTQKSFHFENWRKEWDKLYSDYRTKGKDEAYHQSSHPWRTMLKADPDLTKLKTILEVDKIEACLSSNARLILIPHRDLHRFPLHALFDNHITNYLPSIQIGITQKPTSISSSYSLLSVEDPTRPDQRPLAFAQLESAVIQAIFTSNVQAVTPDEANRATVESVLKKNHGIFHFTGHGGYDSHQPECSVIQLTNTDCLTVKEISKLNLQQYDLVCLSACETALTGMQTINTEYVGLTSAFLQAGASQIVSTLWTVQEVSSAYLMIRFYQLLQKRIIPTEALKQSQSWLRTVTRTELADWLLETSRVESLDSLIAQELEQQAHSLQEEANATTIDVHRPPYADPYHWAAFTITGRNLL